VKDELAVIRGNQERTQKAAETASQAAEFLSKSVTAFGELPRQVNGLSELWTYSLGQKENIFKIVKGGTTLRSCVICLKKSTSDCAKFRGTVSSFGEFLSSTIDASAAVRPWVRHRDALGLPTLILELSKDGARLHEVLINREDRGDPQTYPGVRGPEQDDIAHFQLTGAASWHDAGTPKTN